MKKAHEMLEKAIGRPGLVRAARAMNAARSIGEFLDDRVARGVSVSDYDRGTLVLSCASTALASDLRMQAALLVHRLNERFPEDPPLFTAVRISVQPPRRGEP
ncbi:MAG: DUF721 domain-containing protein [Fimbriimonadaceae bacterium]|nr:DUF721 domain-containing protein [Fimbriimonadaceae bacterium]